MTKRAFYESTDKYSQTYNKIVLQHLLRSTFSFNFVLLSLRTDRRFQNGLSLLNVNHHTKSVETFYFKNETESDQSKGPTGVLLFRCIDF